MSHAIDPWADAPLEQDAPERLKTADMCEDITARLLTAQYNDAPLYPQLVQKVLQELKRQADDPEPDPLSDWARWLLEQLHHRAVTGVQWDEPQEPAWSLDSDRAIYDPPVQRWETTLDDSCGDLG